MASINRGLVWPTLWQLPFQFLNVTEATKWLVKEGFGYHAKTMWHDVRSAFDEVYKKPFQSLLGPKEYLPQNLFIDQEWRRPESYKYYGSAIFHDPVRNEDFGRAYSVYADTSLTDDEVAEIVYGHEEAKADIYGEGWKVIGFISEGRYHKWGAPRSQGFGLAEI